MGNENQRNSEVLINQALTCCQNTNFLLRPQQDSDQLNAHLNTFQKIYLNHDPYYGECHILEEKDGLYVLLKQTFRNQNEYRRKIDIIRQLEVSKDGPSDRYLIATKYIATIEKADFFFNSQELYFEHDFILTDLAQQFNFRKSINERFNEQQIRKIIQSCTHGFLWLQLTHYDSIRMDHIYFVGIEKLIKVAHPYIFSYQSNLSIVEKQQDQKQLIYLSPEQMQALQYCDSTFKGGWISNSYSFGMIILSLMTMDSLNEIYNYQTCQINYNQIERLLDECSGHYSVQLIDIVRGLLAEDRYQRLSFKELHSILERMVIPHDFGQLLIFDKERHDASIIKQNLQNEQESEEDPNYLAELLRPHVSIHGEYIGSNPNSQHLNDSEQDSVIANQRVAYYSQENPDQILGEYIGDTIKFGQKQTQKIRQGRGIYKLRDGQKYIGQWHRGKMHGFGKLYYSSQKLRYEGEFKEGLFHGYGVEYAQEQIEEREEEIDKKYVKLYRGNWIRYEGCYENDVKSGAGRVVFKKGQWRGNFKEDQPHGEGIFMSPSGLETKGLWEKGELVIN